MTKNRQIKLYSKNKNSLNRFLQLLSQINKKWKILTFVVKYNKKKKKKVTVLKSPHVNKKAQTQFQTITYSALVRYSSWESKKNYILLKKIKNHLFPDVNIKQNIFVKSSDLQSANQFEPKKIYYYKSTKSLIENQKSKRSLLVFCGNGKNKKLLLNKTFQFLKVLDHYGNLT